MKLIGGKDNWIKGNVLTNGIDVAKDAAVLEMNR